MSRGLTLVELLVGMVLGLVAAAAMTALLRSGLAAWERAGAHAEVETEVAAAIDQVTRDLRLAGYDPRAAGIAGLTITEAARLELTADLDGNGAIDTDSEERIGYRVATSSSSLQRVVGRQSLPILTDVAASGLRFTYFDAAGNPLAPTAAGTAANTRFVTVDVTTLAHPPQPAVRLGGGARLGNR
jgi:prepilin-type N-terminal cleavage/methylation domain-containing protein